MNKRRRLTGIVTSDKMEKTVVVEVVRTYRHPVYQKVLHSRKRYMAHNTLGCKVGDKVRIVESRPISRHKRWVVEAVLGYDVEVGSPELEEVARAMDEPEVAEVMRAGVEAASEEVVEDEGVPVSSLEDRDEDAETEPEAEG